MWRITASYADRERERTNVNMNVTRQGLNGCHYRGRQASVAHHSVLRRKREDKCEYERHKAGPQWLPPQGEAGQCGASQRPKRERKVRGETVDMCVGVHMLHVCHRRGRQNGTRQHLVLK